MDDALQADLVEPAPEQLHLQAAQIGRQVRRLRRQRVARHVGLIVLGALAILVGDGEAFEIAGVDDALGIERRIVRHFRHRHHRQFAAHQIALERVVVDEDQRIETDVQLLGDGADVLRLVRPVGDEAGDVGALQHHLRMLLERLQRVRLVVLGAHREDDAALGQIARVVLERDEGFAGGAALAEDDAFQAVVADHAAPQRVVEIEHQALRRAALLGGKQPADQIAVERRRGRA